MHAARGGHLGVVRALLAAGAPWNALDRQRKCAGEYAMASMAGPEVWTHCFGGEVWSPLRERERESSYSTRHGVAWHAQAQAVVDALVDHAVVAEMLLGLAGDNAALDARRAAEAAESDEYLGGTVRYEKGRLVDEAEEGVMMEWEAPLMEAHAGLLCGDGGDRDVVNVGFGMVSGRLCASGRQAGRLPHAW